MKRRFWYAAVVLSLLGFVLTGCDPEADVTPAEEMPLVFTPTLEMELAIAVPTFTLSSTEPSGSGLPTAILTPEPSPERLLPATELADQSGSGQIPTFTPDPNLACPPVVANQELEIPIADYGPFMQVDALLDYLNQGGSPEAAHQTIAGAQQGTLEWKDLTGDGRPELIGHLFYFVVYTCEQGQFQERLRVSPMDLLSPPRAEIRDLNANGIPELVVTTMFFGAHDGTLSMYIYEWDGERFANRLSDSIEHPLGSHGLVYVEYGGAHMYNGSVQFSDVDNNGTVEIRLSGGGEDFYERTLWKWNGKEFALVEATQ